jgi:hypothetical protein
MYVCSLVCVCAKVLRRLRAPVYTCPCSEQVSWRTNALERNINTHIHLQRERERERDAHTHVQNTYHGSQMLGKETRNMCVFFFVSCVYLFVYLQKRTRNVCVFRRVSVCMYVIMHV